MAFACLFNKTADQCRLVGARGGRARARNRRLHRAAPLAPTDPAPEPDQETTHEASLLLDERFPHLRATILELLRRDGGATVDEIAAATGWPRRLAGTFRSAVGRHVAIRSIVRTDGRRAYAVYNSASAAVYNCL